MSVIAKLRHHIGWTQEDLAAYMHIGNQAVSRWERGVAYPAPVHGWLLVELAQRHKHRLRFEELYWSARPASMKRHPLQGSQ